MKHICIVAAIAVVSLCLTSCGVTITDKTARYFVQPTTPELVVKVKPKNVSIRDVFANLKGINYDMVRNTDGNYFKAFSTSNAVIKYYFKVNYSSSFGRSSKSSQQFFRFNFRKNADTDGDGRKDAEDSAAIHPSTYNPSPMSFPPWLFMCQNQSTSETEFVLTCRDNSERDLMFTANGISYYAFKRIPSGKWYCERKSIDEEGYESLASISTTQGYLNNENDLEAEVKNLSLIQKGEINDGKTYLEVYYPDATNGVFRLLKYGEVIAESRNFFITILTNIDASSGIPLGRATGFGLIALEGPADSEFKKEIWGSSDLGLLGIWVNDFTSVVYNPNQTPGPDVTATFATYAYLLIPEINLE